MTTPTNTFQSIPFAQIAVKDELNSRTDLPKIQELAESIQEQGLLQPLVVEPRGDGKFILRAGFRRAAALKLLKWGSKPVTVIVLQPEVPGEIANLTENLAREDLHHADLAQRLHDLFTGEYEVPKGGKAVAYTKEEIGRRLGMSKSHVANLIRTHTNLTAACKKAWRVHNLPINVAFRLASMDEDTQERELSAYLERKAKLDEVSKRGKRQKEEPAFDHSDKEEDADDAEETEDAAEEEPRSALERPASTRPGKRLILDTLTEMKAELETASAKEMAIIKAKVDTLKWVLGERKTFPKGAQ